MSHREPIRNLKCFGKSKTITLIRFHYSQRAKIGILRRMIPLWLLKTN